jgi:hypothetical protein
MTRVRLLSEWQGHRVGSIHEVEDVVGLDLVRSDLAEIEAPPPPPPAADAPTPSPAAVPDAVAGDASVVPQPELEKPE